MPDTVLIIDDDDRLLNALQIRLRAAGYTVHSAPNGEVGASQAALFHPDVIVLDIHMPDMTGYDVCRLLRSIPDLSHIPIVILTASNAARSAQQALEAGSNRYFQKPYVFSELVTALRGVVGTTPRACLHTSVS
jgi:DNA-binding response OmpR family regulator